ncbi:hypothetical protein, partial [uncultured Prevotella sp.]|uniref:hypothetical protein n=1 Tax=uncultured Prevotella sp. TaxID=159272 RepID=UPI00259881A8
KTIPQGFICYLSFTGQQYIRMKRFYVSERLWFFHQNYTENIHKFNGRITKNAFAGVLQRRFLSYSLCL